jgi:hypothetical protein
MAAADRGVRYEHRDAHIRGVVAAALIIAGTVGFAAGAAWLFSGWIASGREGASNARPPHTQGIRLQSAAPIDLAEYRREKQRQLDGYGWIDRQSGRVHIPIARAMDIMGRQERAPAPSSKGKR